MNLLRSPVGGALIGQGMPAFMNGFQKKSPRRFRDEAINDACKSASGGQPRRYIGLWERSNNSRCFGVKTS